MPFNYVVLINERKFVTIRYWKLIKLYGRYRKSHNVRYSYQKLGRKVNIISQKKM